MKEKYIKIVEELFIAVNEEFLKQGADLERLKNQVAESAKERNNEKTWLLISLLCSMKFYFTLLISLLIAKIIHNPDIIFFFTQYIGGTRCLIPNNYLIWEFTRPVSNCDFCRGINSALILPNLTRQEFEPYAYSSRPIVIKNAAKSWKASKVFNLQFFRDLYENIDGAYESIEEECQFLPFTSNFSSLKQVLTMTDSRAANLNGEDSWYVGWKNCHPQILDTMKQYYDPPHFLPVDAEIPQTNYIFLGYDQGAIMHLDYIPRLMWQGQILGKKSWSVAPTPECDNVCEKFDFFVDAGDVILLDTRIWYHGTYVENGQFSLTVTSEYG